MRKSGSNRSIRAASMDSSPLLALRNWSLPFTTETGTGIADIWAGLVLLAAVALIVHRVLARPARRARRAAERILSNYSASAGAPV